MFHICMAVLNDIVDTVWRIQGWNDLYIGLGNILLGITGPAGIFALPVNIMLFAEEMEIGGKCHVFWKKG